MVTLSDIHQLKKTPKQINMKKLFILLMVFGFFVTACNNNKTGKNKNTNNREKDDYGKNDNLNKENEKKNDENTLNNGNDNNSNSMTSGWTSSDINIFVTNCVSTAVQGGMSQELSQKYCSCMAQKFEKMFPNPNDVTNVTEEQMNSPSMTAMAKECLTGN